MAEHLATTIVKPLWCQTDAEVSREEQRTRLSLFRVKTLANVEQDCTAVVTFCEAWKTEGLYQQFAPTWDAFCVDVLKVQPAWVERLCAGLHLLRAEGYKGEVPAAVALRQQVEETEALQKRGTNQHTEREDMCMHISSKDLTQKEYRIARLKRDRPDIAEALAHGEYPSVRAAAKAAGIVHDPTPLDYLHRYWRKVDPADRIRFLIEMLTPNERRALMLGFDEEDN